MLAVNRSGNKVFFKSKFSFDFVKVNDYPFQWLLKTRFYNVYCIIPPVKYLLVYLNDI